jgi:putative transcriptional regulator
MPTLFASMSSTARLPKSDAMASIHEAMSDMYEIGLIDAQTMTNFDDMCLTDVALLVEEAGTEQAPVK